MGESRPFSFSILHEHAFCCLINTRLKYCSCFKSLCVSLFCRLACMNSHYTDSLTTKNFHTIERILVYFSDVLLKTILVKPEMYNTY